MMRALQAAAAVGLVLLVALLALPLAGLVTRIPLATLLERLQEPEVLEALRLSLLTSVASTDARGPARPSCGASARQPRLPR